MEAPVIPQIRALHRLMAKMIAGKAALLEGPEVRFLRKSAGLSSKDCAEALGVTATYLSNVESGRANIGRPADRLLRLLGTRPVDPKAELMRLAAAARESGKAPARRETYWRHGWKPAA
jgi:DNA-binding transcriptional regulator YiaG